MAPAHTPEPIIDKLNATINQGLKTPEFAGALAKISVDPLGGTPEDLPHDEDGTRALVADRQITRA